MGLFATWLFDDGGWSQYESGASVDFTGAALMVYVHDSDFVEVKYHPAGSGTGVAYLNLSPRVYFDSEDTETTVAAREAAGLAQWWALRNPGRDIQEKRDRLGDLLFDDADALPPGEDPGVAVFAEDRLNELVRLLELPDVPPVQE